MRAKLLKLSKVSVKGTCIRRQVEPGGEFLVCLARACEAMPLQSLRALGDLEHWTQELPRIDFRTIRIQVFRQNWQLNKLKG